MIQDADKLQNDFKELCQNNGVRGSFAYFIDHDHRAMFSFNDINDSELMHAAASIAAMMMERSGEKSPGLFLFTTGEKFSIL